MKEKAQNKKKQSVAVILAVFMIFAAPFFACAKVPEKKTAQKLYEEISPSVCVVRSDYSEGTGFVVKLESGSFFVLTNKHVLSSGEFIGDSAQIGFLNGKSYTAALIGYNTYHDIALLKVDSAPHEGMKELIFRPDTAANGQKLYSIGNALELGLAMFEGIVSYNNRALEVGTAAKRVPVIQITVPVNAGSSGAPVFDEYGYVAGVATYQIPMFDQRLVDGISFCVDAVIVKSIFEQIIREYKVKNTAVGECGLLDVKLTRINIGEKTGIDVIALNFTGVLEDGGLKITSCSSLESAAGVQLENGDIITKIGSLALADAALTDIFCELYKYSDSRLDADINEDAQLKIYFMRGTKNSEMTVLNKYEKNN